MTGARTSGGTCGLIRWYARNLTWARTLLGCCGNVAAGNGRERGAAWLSSARAVRCRVKSHNERNPYVQLPAGRAGDSGWTAGVSREEGGDDVKSARPLRPGLHTCYNGRYSGRRPREGERIPKAGRSSDRSLEPDSVKLDSLVIAHQPRRGEYVPGPCTHRPSSHGSWGCLKSVTVRSGLG